MPNWANEDRTLEWKKEGRNKGCPKKVSFSQKKLIFFVAALATLWFFVMNQF